MDLHQLQKRLKGIYTLPDIQYLEVKDLKDEIIYVSGVPGAKNGIKRVFPLFFIDSNQVPHANIDLSSH